MYIAKTKNTPICAYVLKKLRYTVFIYSNYWVLPHYEYFIKKLDQSFSIYEFDDTC